MRKVISPDTVHKPTTVYSHAVVIGNTVYTAGQAPHTLNGDVWPRSDPTGQVRLVFENLTRVLEASNVGLENIIRLTIFVRSMDVITQVWSIATEYLGDNKPAVTIAIVEGLAGTEYLLELDAVAHL
jgi:2-iminobutanoate/2-iminopropanoate deaminase